MKLKELCFLVRLRAVISLPDLLVAQFDSLGDSGCGDFASIRFLRGRGRAFLAINRVFNRIDMLTAGMASIQNQGMCR